jgi:CubicO group peptidase (beta-lactamase class C family)
MACLCYINVQAQYDFSRLDAWLAAHTQEMGGRAILLVYKDGKVVYDHGVKDMTAAQEFAWKAISRRRGIPADLKPYSDTSRTYIASCSKWLSAALVMTFVDEGKLRLTDTVGKYLPLLSAHGKGNITISECLSHMTGIQAPDLRQEMAEHKKYNSMDDAIADIAAEPMEGTPGKTFHYSSTGLQIAGAVIERISGKSFESLFQERIARPLNMTRSSFGNEKVALPAGGAQSTPTDYINFLTMIYNKGVFNGKRILSENAITEMQQNRMTADTKIVFTPSTGTHWGYGYGEWVLQSGTPGSWVTSPGLFGSIPWVDYHKHYAAFLMTFYLKDQNKQERYVELKKLVDEALAGK